MPDRSVRGQFLWHELMTSDPGAAAAFYAKLIGWGSEKWQVDPSYTQFTYRGAAAAGLMAIPPGAKAMGAPPSWMVYIGTPDVPVTAWEAQRFGGKLLKEPTKTPHVGTWAVLQDPQGAVFGAYTPERPKPAPGPPKVGEFSWHELGTTDALAALSFYHQLFGWEKTGSHDMGPMGVYHMYGWKGKTLGGMYNMAKDMPAPPHWLCYAKVPNSSRAAELITQEGGKVVTGPMEVPGGDWIAVGADPQGAVFAVHTVKAKKATVRRTKVKKATPKRARAQRKTRAKKSRATRKPAKRAKRK